MKLLFVIFIIYLVYLVNIAGQQDKNLKKYSQLRADKMPLYKLQITDIRPGQIYINSYSSHCYQKTYELQGGNASLSFGFSMIKTLQNTDSGILVKWNNQQIQRIVASQSGKAKKIQIPNISKGSHSLQICLYGLQNLISTALIKNVVLQEKLCQAKLLKNLIKNGGFEQANCPRSYCIFQARGYKQSDVPGWLPNPQIQINPGEMSNRILGKTKVSELDADKNTCIKQLIKLKIGRYNLGFDWSAKTKFPFETSSFEVKMNGQVIKAITPSDYQIHRQSIDIQLGSKLPVESQLQFCGTGPSDKYGAVVDNIELAQYNECGEMISNRY